MRKLIDQEQYQRRVDDEAVQIAFYTMPQALIDDDNILNEATGVDSVSGDGSAYLETVRSYILKEEDEKLADAVRLGSQDRMQDFNMSLKSLIDQELISQDVAMGVSPNRQQLKMVLKGIDVAQGGLL